VSWAEREEDETRFSISIAPMSGRGSPRRFTYGKRDHSPRWSPDGKQLSFISNRGKKSQIYLAPMNGGEARQLTKAKFGLAQSTWSPDGKRISFVARVGDYVEPQNRKGAERAKPRVVRDMVHKQDGIGFYDNRRMHLFTVEVDGGGEQQVTSGDWNDYQPGWSPDGKHIAFASDRERSRHQRHDRSDIWIVSTKGGRARKLTRSRGRANLPSYSPDGRFIAYLGHERGNEGSANAHVFIQSATGRSAPRSISASLDRSPAALAGNALQWSSNSRSVFFMAGDHGSVCIFRAGTANGSVSKVLSGDHGVDGFEVSPDGRSVVFSSSWTTAPGEVYSAPLRGSGRERKLSDANDQLRKTVSLGKMRRMTYRANDGLPIEMFVLYPPNYRLGRRYPLALNIHGGPHGSHPNGAALVALQSLAGAGYVVMLPNPRGSSTYGEAFTEACVNDWGGADYEDIMTGVDVLVRRKIADPDRLFVGGYSYGGFMSSWVVGHTDRFRAATIGAPVTNLVSMFGEGDIPLFDIHEIGGTPYSDRHEYEFRSPIRYLENVHTPVLLLHWEGDLRCPIGQSEELFAGLKVLGKKAEFVRYPGGSHGGRTPSQAVDQAKRTLAWYASHQPRKAVKKPAKASRNRRRNGAGRTSDIKNSRTRAARR
jgi:dipeptidyl aminopeptidase/acylaminoacyl peptidase